jgi:hypothetical protein
MSSFATVPKVKVGCPTAWHEGIYGAVEVQIYLFSITALGGV